MKCINRYNSFLNRIKNDFRKIKYKPALIVSLICFVLGLITWIFGGSAHRVLIIYAFPKSAMPLAIMYILWGFSYLACGFVLGALLFNCDIYRRQNNYKICVTIVMMQLFTLVAYPLFFGANSPFVSFLSFIISLVLCFFAISLIIKMKNCLSLFMIIHFVWLSYNAYITLAFSMIN